MCPISSYEYVNFETASMKHVPGGSKSRPFLEITCVHMCTYGMYVADGRPRLALPSLVQDIWNAVGDPRTIAPVRF